MMTSLRTTRKCRPLLLGAATLIGLLIAGSAAAQDTLPNFTVEDRGGGRVIVSWTNPYPTMIQLAVQRSYDSIKRFGSIYSATSPELPVNGFADKAVPGTKPFYRIFYVLQGGAYYFTASKRATVPQPKPVQVTVPAKTSGKDSVVSFVPVSTVPVDMKREQLDPKLIEILAGRAPQDMELYPPDKQFFIKVADSLWATFNTDQFFDFRDSVVKSTKDTLYQIDADTMVLGIYVPPYAQSTSEYVYTDRDGYVVIKLPEADKKKYELRFFEEDDTPVLEIKHVKEPLLILDKTTFYHSGWFKFELKENGRAKERNKIFLAKDFSP